MFFTLFLFFDPTANFWRSAIAWYLIPKLLVLALDPLLLDAHSESTSINKKTQPRYQLYPKSGFNSWLLLCELCNLNWNGRAYTAVRVVDVPAVEGTTGSDIPRSAWVSAVSRTSPIITIVLGRGTVGVTICASRSHPIGCFAVSCIRSVKTIIRIVIIFVAW